MMPNVQYDCWKRKVLSRRRNVDSDGAETTSSGSAFHFRGETLKVRLQTSVVWTTAPLGNWCWQSVVPDDQADQLLGRVVRGTAAQCRAKFGKSALW